MSPPAGWPPLLLAAALLAALAPAPLGAQESVFGQLGFGLPEDGLSVRSRGMGNASTALPGIHFTFRNPASLSVFDRTGISIAGLFQTLSPEDAGGESSRNSATIPFVQLAFPLGHGFVLGGGYYRYLDFEGFIDTATPFQGDSLPLRLTSDGGISVLAAQLARWFSSTLRVGAGVDFYTGSRAQRRRIEFDPNVGVATTDSLLRGFEGVGFSAGVQVGPARGLLLGVGYRSGVMLGGDLEAGAGEGAEGREVEVELPASVYAAASYRPHRRLLVAAELERAAWSEFAIAGANVAGYGDVVGFGGGVEYSFPEGLFFLPQATVLRAGARTRELPQRFGGNVVRERALTAGLGQLVGIGASNLDLSLELGKRGSLDRNGLEETFLRLGVAFSAFEKWTSGAPRPGGE